MTASPPTPAPAPSGPAWERLEDQLGWYDGKSVASQRAYKRFKLVQLVVSATVPVLAALSAPAAVTAASAAVVVVAEGVVQLNQWQTTWVQYRATAEALKHEKHLYLAAAGPYPGPDRDRVLAERVEGLVSQEHAKWTEARSRSAAEQPRLARTARPPGHRRRTGAPYFPAAVCADGPMARPVGRRKIDVTPVGAAPPPRQEN